MSITLTRRLSVFLQEVDRIVAERSQPLASTRRRLCVYVEVAVRADKGRVFGLGYPYLVRQGPIGTSSWNSSATLQSHLDPNIRVELEAKWAETDRLRQKVVEIWANHKDAERLRSHVEQMQAEQRRAEARQQLLWVQLHRRLDDQGGL